MGFLFVLFFVHLWWALFVFVLFGFFAYEGGSPKNTLPSIQVAL